MKRYIAEYLNCARYNLATRSQSLHLIRIIFSFQLIRINFVDSFERIALEIIYILVLICYISRFIILFAYKNINIEDIIWYLKLFFVIYRRSYIFYCDSSYYFFNKKLRKYLREKEIIINYRSFEALKNIKIIKVYNRLLEDVLYKNSKTYLKWD